MSLRCNAGVLVIALIAPAWGGAETAAAADTGDLVSLDLRTLMQMDVKVTAQRHEESAQNASVSIDVASPTTLRNSGVYQPKDLQNVALGLQVGMSGSSTQLFIRGVGDASLEGSSNPGVAFNVDGVYISRPASDEGQFFDLARIEVLKGPQGTLYGRNSNGGAINVISNRPNFDGTSGYLQEEVGNYGLTATEAALNLPVSDLLALRGAFQVVSRQGYLNDGKDDDHHRSGRIQALFKPEGDISLLAAAEYIQLTGRGPGYVYTDQGYQALGQTPPNPWTGVSSARATALLASYAALLGLPPFANFAADSPQDNRFWNIYSQLDWDLGFARLTVLPAYTRADNQNSADAGFQINYNETSRATSLEARLAHQTQRLQWVAGLYYFDESQTFSISLHDAPLTQNVSTYDPGTRAYAAFAEATLSLTDSLRLISGVRYTDDKRTLENGGGYSVFPSIITGCLNPLAPVCEVAPYAGDASFSKVSWKAGAEYDLSPTSLLFLTAATGFKAGGLNPAPGAGPFGPENLTAYTLGSRNRFADNRVQANLEGFWWNYSGAQQPYVTNGVLLLSNVGRVRIYGVNVDLRAQATSMDAVHVEAEYNQAKYIDFVHLDNGTDSIFCPDRPAGLVDCSDAPLDHTAKWSAVADWTHLIKLRKGATITSTLTARYLGEHYLEYNLTPGEFARAATTEDASVGYSPSSSKWSVTAFVRNISDRAVYSGASVGLLGTTTSATIGAPRTFGARFNFQF